MKIWNFRIIKENEYLRLKKDSKNWRERSAIVKDNDIQKLKEKLKKKYKNFIGKKYHDNDEGIVFEIDGIYYDGYFSYDYCFEDKFKFSTSAYNNPNWNWNVDINSIVDGEYEECGKVNKDG